METFPQGSLPHTLSLSPIKQEILRNASTADLIAFADQLLTVSDNVIGSMSSWHKGGTKVDGTVQIYQLKSDRMRDQLGISGHWCGRQSTHIRDQAGTYEQFKEGLMENHSQHEQEYVGACTDADLLDDLSAGPSTIAQIWRMAYATPWPSSPRTFVILLISRQIQDEEGRRAFINVSLPVDHPQCLPNVGGEAKRVRATYVSVEKVQEVDGGQGVEWSMCTSSDAGGNIPQAITNLSLPSQISADVPSFIQWMRKRKTSGQTQE